MERTVRSALLLLLLAAIPGAARAQTIHGIVLDQTGLPLPGATIQLFDDSRVVATTSSEPDGTFALDASVGGDAVEVSLQGFDPVRVPRVEAARVVLPLARATEVTSVVAPTIAPSSPTAALLGSTLNATTVARLPSAHMKARESLPLLPSVIRGPDGLMQLGGARASETPLLLDGFNITDPATGISSMNLPFEAVQGVDVLRDPMAVGYGGLVGGLVKVESKPGGESFATGVQGFVPRPRFATPGFGRIEGIFPRAYASGAAAGGAIHYVAAAEYDFEHFPVPEVTTGRGPDIVDASAIIFTRVDARLSDRHTVTVEGFLFPTRTRSLGLSPRRAPDATADLSGGDRFVGVTDRVLTRDAGVVTVQVGALRHEADLTPNGTGVALLSPFGWTGHGFATVERHATRYTAAATWERITKVAGRFHDVMVSGEIAVRRLRGRVSEETVRVEDADGRLVRQVDFGAAALVGASDRPVGLAVRDVWQANERTQVDAGVRLDHSRHGGAAPSGRIGVRYAVDASGLTVLKAGVGRFVGNLPLASQAFGGYPSRVDRWFDPASGDVVRAVAWRPVVGRLDLPRARAVTVALERQIFPGLDAQVSATDRQSARLSRLMVPAVSGDLAVESSGASSYREVQVSARRTWANEQQLFVSYVRSYARGDLNDFAATFQALDAPLLQPGGLSRLPSDVRNRVLLWGTFNLPRRIVVSPVTEWHSGFPYSALTERYVYAGPPNTRAFPGFLATDVVVYKTVTVRDRNTDIGVQLFNITDRRNPRDVYPVIGSPLGGTFTNSVGPIVRGYMLLKW